jgi:dethiobiotin synthetase
MADVAAGLDVPVILVVGMRLGCLNHALLSAESIKSKGVFLAGWVANCIEPAMKCVKENISTLTRQVPAPLLGTVPHSKSTCIDDVAQGCLDIVPLGLYDG